MTEFEQEIYDNPILVYCNWSFDKSYHLRLADLIEVVSEFNIEHSPFYLRIFNETPPRLVRYFIESNNLDDAPLREIYNILNTNYSVRLNNDFWEQYENADMAAIYDNQQLQQ